MYERTVKDRVAGRIAGFGALLALLGLMSSVITFVGYELRVLMWIDLWGPLVAWGIRLGLIVGGSATYLVAIRFDKGESPEVLRASRAAAEERRRREWEATMWHPRTVQVVADMAREAHVVWEPTGAPGEHVIRKVVWLDGQQRWQLDAQGRAYGPDDPQVTSVAVYVESASPPPRRLVCTQDLATRRLVWQDAHPGMWALFL